MAANLDDLVSVRILFDKEKNQVICAEAGSDFIDILFSFLALPMGTIVRLLRKENSSAHIGCLRNLYQSVEDLSLDNFNTDLCKDMLTYPKSSLETIYKDLKVNVDDTPIRYFLCANVACRHMMRYYKNAKCLCGNLLNSEAIDSSSVVEELSPKKNIVEVFVKNSTTYFVTDDMKVMHGTPGTLLQMLNERGIQNVNLVGEKILKLGLGEILNLLVHTLVSKTPLTDSFFPNQKMNCKSISGEKRDRQVTAYGTSVDASNKSVEIKTYIRKSNKKPLYAEATEDFVDLLCSFLTFPLSNVVSLLSGDSSFGCVDNLYKSVQGLDDKWFVSKEELDKDHLVKTAPKFSCYIADFIFGKVKVREEVRLVKNKSGSIRGVSSGYYLSPGEVLLKITNHTAPKWGCVVHSFLKKPAMFLVSDSLVIKSCDKTTTNISFLKGLDVPIDDIEEHTIKIAKQQVLGILKASLTTNSAFSSLIGLLPKKPKPESF